MAGTFTFELVTPERLVMSEDAVSAVVPGMEGQFTVLANHAPVISTLRPGVLDVALGDARRVRLFVKGGFVEVDAESLTVLAERALDLAHIDAATVDAELEVAEAELAQARDDATRLTAHAAVDQLKALAR
jgi:F-type H+-transporting ATPase subunit epsilon